MASRDSGRNDSELQAPRLDASSASEQATPIDPEPRWQAVIATLAAGGLYLALPAGLTVGPRWFFPVLVGLLIVTIFLFHRTGQHHVDRILGFMLISLITGQMIVSLVLLVTALPGGGEAATAL